MNRRDFIGAASLAACGGLAGLRADTQQKIRKAVLISMLPKELSYADRFALALECGFEAIEAQTVTDPKEAEEIRLAATKTGIRIHSVMNMGHWEWPLSSADSAIVTKSLERMEVSMRNASLWGADSVLLVPAVVNPETSIPVAWQRSVPQIRKLIPLAQKLRVVIGIEEVWNKFLLTPYDHARYVDEFKSPWVRAYFDVGNIVMYGYPQEWIRHLGKRIGRFHLKDFDTKTRQFVNLGDGSIDWKEVRKAIADIGYSGYATVELSGGDKAYLRDVSKRVDRLLLGA